MPETRAAPRKGILLKIAAAGLVALVAVALIAYAVGGKALLAEGRTLAAEGMAVVRSAGPWAFFAALALLPAIGAPLSFFALAAGPAFSERLGLGGVIAAYGAALTVNLLLTYWIARWGLRPLIARLVARFGYQIPRFDEEEQMEITVLLRITPGPPFFVQSYLLGLGNVGFVTYFLVSWGIVMAQGVGIIVFGDAVLHGRAAVAVTGVSIVLAAALITHLVRKHLGGRPSPR